jgi:carboxylesterase
MIKPSILRNPQLDGAPFYWPAGPIGILLCHGFTATTAEVRLMAGALHKDGYTIAAPLLPGHGTTPLDCNHFTWQDWFDRIEQTYLQLASRCDRVVIGGESTGALLVLYLAVKHPESAGILCYAPALRLRLRSAEKLLLYILSPFIATVPKPPPADDNAWQGYAVQPLKGAVQLLRLQKAILTLLPQIHQPILIVQGRLDPTVHPESPKIIYDRVSSAFKELHWLEHSAHCVILDNEHNLVESLTIRFLNQVFHQASSREAISI